jgi:hypothetical protein
MACRRRSGRQHQCGDEEDEGGPAAGGDRHCCAGTKASGH